MPTDRFTSDHRSIACSRVSFTIGLNSGSPSSRPIGSPGPAIAGSTIRSQSNGFPSCSRLTSRPTKSSSCHLVITTSTRYGGSSRVCATDSHQFHSASRLFGLWASTKSLIGSSMISTRAPRPVRLPPTEVANIPPPSTVSHTPPAPPSALSAIPSPGRSSTVSRIPRVHAVVRLLS